MRSTNENTQRSPAYCIKQCLDVHKYQQPSLGINASNFSIYARKQMCCYPVHGSKYQPNSLFSWPFFFPGLAGQCRTRRGYLVVVVAEVACMWVRSLAPSPCPAHNAVVHTERSTEGPRVGWPLLQRWPRGRFLWPAWDRPWQLWGRLLCKYQFTIMVTLAFKGLEVN